MIKGGQVLRCRTSLLVLGLALPIILGACSAFLQPSPSSHSSTTTLQGGVLVTFEVEGETFNIWVLNNDTIGQVVSIYRGENASLVPFGNLIRGPGENNHNLPYNWHLDPNSILLVKEAPDQGCITNPILIEQNFEQYIGEEIYFCPSSAKLIKLIDYRIPPPAILKGN